MGRRGRPPGWTPPRKNPRRRERGLYRRLLDLGRRDEPEPFLREALGLIVEVTAARHGYLELHDDDRTGTPRWALAHGFTAEQLAGVRAAISGGIIAEAVATGKTIVTPSALLAERFRARESVRLGPPEALIESELFGALPGAHSTATRRIEGKVESAERGTLFLDEIGELSHAAQAKLLHLLQAKEYYPLGGTKPLRANVRVIAATNTDLQQAVGERRFREDLFYRLQVLPIRVPSLAERAARGPVGGVARQRPAARERRGGGGHPGGGRARRAGGAGAPFPGGGRAARGRRPGHLPGGDPPLPGAAPAGRAGGRGLERGRHRAPPRPGALARLQPDPGLRAG